MVARGIQGKPVAVDCALTRTPTQTTAARVAMYVGLTPTVLVAPANAMKAIKTVTEIGQMAASALKNVAAQGRQMPEPATRQEPRRTAVVRMLEGAMTALLTLQCALRVTMARGILAGIAKEASASQKPAHLLFLPLVYSS